MSNYNEFKRVHSELGDTHPKRELHSFGHSCYKQESKGRERARTQMVGQERCGPKLRELRKGKGWRLGAANRRQMQTAVRKREQKRWWVQEEAVLSEEAHEHHRAES